MLLKERKTNMYVRHFLIIGQVSYHCELVLLGNRKREYAFTYLWIVQPDYLCIMFNLSSDTKPRPERSSTPFDSCAQTRETMSLFFILIASRVQARASPTNAVSAFDRCMLLWIFNSVGIIQSLSLHVSAWERLSGD